MGIFDPFPVLATPRTLLCELTLADVDRMFAIRGDPRVARYLGRDPEASPDTMRLRIQGVIDGIAEGSSIRWAIVSKPTGALLGSSGLWHWDKEHRWAELGYEIAPEAWGQGLMAEVNRAIIAWAFGPPMRLHRVEARIDPANQQSRRVLDKLGFTHEGTLRQSWFHRDLVTDTDVFGLLAGELRGP
ncbi:MAG: GNAT family N-acetyltransferase [Deltaproteobacteria bacterium]|nr:GNAT family N-acetyltransferase [Deltaproteobacteria bacterium]